MSLLIMCNSTKTNEVVIIPEGKVGMIGYGSLTSKEQMEIQLNSSYTGPFRIIHLEGYQRYWNFLAPNDSIHPPFNSIMKCIIEMDTIIPENCIYLNIQESENNWLNCCFFIIDKKDLQTMDKTEIGYKRIEVSDAIREFDVIGGPVYSYQALPEYSKEPVKDKPQINAIASSYIDFLNKAFENLGSTYKQEFNESTIGFDESLVLDCYFYGNP